MIENIRRYVAIGAVALGVLGAGISWYNISSNDSKARSLPGAQDIAQIYDFNRQFRNFDFRKSDAELKAMEQGLVKRNELIAKNREGLQLNNKYNNSSVGWTLFTMVSIISAGVGGGFLFEHRRDNRTQASSLA